jgi:hypothetical protein
VSGPWDDMALTPVAELTGQLSRCDLLCVKAYRRCGSVALRRLLVRMLALECESFGQREVAVGAYLILCKASAAPRGLK